MLVEDRPPAAPPSRHTRGRGFDFLEAESGDVARFDPKKCTTWAQVGSRAYWLLKARGCHWGLKCADNRGVGQASFVVLWLEKLARGLRLKREALR